MAITTFAAIDVGSYEVSMKIYELSKRYGIREVNYVRYRMELGRDAYAKGKIGHALSNELCRVISSYVSIMEEYQVTEYRACATSALRELKNPNILIEQVYQKTGVRIEVLSNAEQRFLSYKSIASMENEFQNMIQKGTAILDVGGGSIQISLFDQDTLVSTQNLKLGILRIRERLRKLEKDTIHYDRLLGEFINNELIGYKRLYLKDREIRHVILMGDFFTDTIFHGRNVQRVLTKEDMEERYEKIIHASPDALVEELEIPLEYASLVMPTIVLYKSFADIFGAEVMWAPGTILADGIAYDYGERNKIIKTTHNFENDILISAKNIAKRYNSNKQHIQAVDQYALAIFDGMKKVHGMGPRERLLLQIAVQLHDCGKYISMGNVAQCAYNIIMSTEIIGLSQPEREIIANVVKYNTTPFEYFEEMNRGTGINKRNYLLVAKLTALLRLANSLDRSHHQKISNIKASVKEDELILLVDTTKDLSLERGLLEDKAEFFEEVFSLSPIIKQKRQR